MFVSPKHQIIGVPARPDLATLFPAAKRVTFKGSDLLLLHHGVDETRLLRNMDLDVPAPISVGQYDFEGGTPFDVQIKTCALLTTSPRAYVLNAMGTGKTKSALWSWRFLNKQGQAGKMLVVAPLSTLNFTWAREVFTTLPGVKVQVLHGTRKRRLERFADLDADIYIVNHHGLAVIADELAARKDIDTLVLDELAVYRNGTSTLNKVTRKVAASMKWVWGMTGSPTPQAPTDAWGQCMVVTPNTVPRYFARFRDDVMFKVSQFRWVAKPNALDTVHAVMQPAVRYTLDDIVELPELIERTIDIEMGPKQKTVYEQMERHAAAMLTEGTVDAMNAGAVLSKLLQISTGYVYTRDGSTIPLDNDNRLDALIDVIDAADKKLLVFVPFKHALAGISERMTKEKIDHAVVSGDTPSHERGSIFNAFQNSDKYKVLAAHPQCMAHGVTLTAATTIVWFAPTSNLETFEQANARIRRYGQKNRQQILMFQATKAERSMYQKLRSKQRVQNLLLELFETSTT